MNDSQKLTPMQEAAGEMYEALRTISGQIRHEHDRGGGLFSTAEVIAVEAALAKAEGRG